MSKLKTIILILEESGCLPAIYRPHKLVVSMSDFGNATFHLTGY